MPLSLLVFKCCFIFSICLRSFVNLFGLVLSPSARWYAGFVSFDDIVLGDPSCAVTCRLSRRCLIDVEFLLVFGFVVNIIDFEFVCGVV